MLSGRERRSLRVACVQTHGGAADKQARIERVRELCDGLTAVDLLVLPELWATGYFNFERYAEDAEPLGDGPAQTALRELALQTGAWVVGGSIVARASDGALSNATPIVSPTGEVVASYRKRHLFGHGSQERELLRAGATSTSFTAGDTRVGLALCYDLRFPEAFGDYVADGCELYVVPAAWPAPRADHWEKLLAARAIEGQAFAIGCNGCGEEQGVALGGRSSIFDPWGRGLGQCSATEEDVVVAELDLSALEEYREAFPPATERRLAAQGAIADASGAR